jgi:tetratricopeptide (TPR) repeat protein
VLKVMPNDSVAVMNQANLYLATGRYTESIAVIDRLLQELPPDTPNELTDVLTYRKVLALVLLDKTPEAKKLVAHLNAFSDTPLYYYSQAAFYLAEDKKVEAARSLRSVGKIFAKSASLASYQRALELSRLAATDSPR